MAAMAGAGAAAELYNPATDRCCGELRLQTPRVRGQSIRQRPPGTATQNSRFGVVPRAWW